MPKVLCYSIRGNATAASFHQRFGATRLLLPFLLTFNLATLALYVFGPVSYGDGPSLSVVIYTLLYLSGFWVGNKIAMRYYVRSTMPLPHPTGFVIFASIIVLVFSLPALIPAAGRFESSSLGQIYSIADEARLEDGPIIEYIRMLFGIFFVGLQPVLLVYWKDLSRSARVLGLIGLMATVSMGIVSGINKPLFDFAAGFLILWLAGLWRPKVSLKQKLLGWGVTLAILVGLAAYFTETQLTRSGSPLVSGYDSRTGMSLKYSEEDGRFLAFYAGVSAYLTQGYRGFEYALDEDWEPTYGLGNSIFLARQADRLLGSEFSDQTYPAKIERHGWDRLINWSTFYVWIASDVHFVGVIIFMTLLGGLWRVVTNSADICRFGSGRSIVAVVLFYYLCFGLFYLSANNQLLQSGIGVSTFFVLMALFFGFGRITKFSGDSKTSVK